jgi:hypothetical protein
LNHLPGFFSLPKIKMLMRQFLWVAFLAVLVSSCGPTIYKADQFSAVASKHKIVAILPSDVNITLRPNEMKKTSPEQLAKNEESTGYAMQDKLYGWFLKRQNKFHYTVKFQDVMETNSQLNKAGISYADLRTKSRKELAQLLGVDAVISSNVRMDKPMSDGAALAVGAVFGVWGSTNKANTTINIHEGSTGNLMWKYQYEAQGSVGSSPDNLVDALMRNASRNFPYNGK